MDNNTLSVLTAKGGKYELKIEMRDKLALLGDGSVLINENYRLDVDVLNKLAFYKNILVDGKNITTKEKIKYVSAEDIRNYYDDNLRLTFLQDTNQIQKKVMDLISVAFSKKATDIHIELRAPSTFIQFRILGSLSVYQQLTFDDGNALCNTLYNSMTLSSGISFTPSTQQDANMKHEFLPDGLAGVRVATGPLQGGNSFMVLRLRLIKIGADRNLLLSPEMITGLFAQHLIPELCPKCKIKLVDRKDLLPDDLINRLENVFKEHDGLDGVYIKNNEAVESCGFYDESTDRTCIAGYIGRTVVAEAIIPDEQYLQYMREGKMFDAYKYWINNLNGYTMMCHGLAKVKRGIVDPRALEGKLKRLSIQDNLAFALTDF